MSSSSGQPLRQKHARNRAAKNPLLERGRREWTDGRYPAAITVPGCYDSRVRANLIEAGDRAVLAVPMIHQDRLVGVSA